MASVTWDYTELARAYLKRPDYAAAAVDWILERAGASAGTRAADIGAGTAHLTLPLAERGLIVDAVEPNAEMRRYGRERTAGRPTVRWHDATAEATGLPGGSYRLVTFGSSFNVTDRPAALRETARLLEEGGWFACLWNHRDLDDPLQREVEAAIRSEVPAYDPGTRREDQGPVIDASGLFGTVERFEAPVRHRVAAADWIEAWRSHATLQRQAGGRFAHVVDKIASVVSRWGETLEIPYTTRVWAAPARGERRCAD